MISVRSKGNIVYVVAQTHSHRLLSETKQGVAQLSYIKFAIDESLIISVYLKFFLNYIVDCEIILF